MFTITDYSTDKAYEAADRFDLEDRLNGLFDRDAEACEGTTVGEVIDELVAKVVAHEYRGNEESTLNIHIEEA